MNFVAGISYLTLLSSIGRSATFFLYAGIAIMSVVFMRLRVPEAHGRSLSEVEAELHACPVAAAAPALTSEPTSASVSRGRARASGDRDAH
ncbi:MFS transporter [Frankia sp. AgPm24]|uniref:MFS transporter n=1 Tax=Frankia sp. AgPm24 TaxID=631128 RepID=UPI0020105BB2|nr:MFS transporter [Frankia sp. AgPm24]